MRQCAAVICAVVDVRQHPKNSRCACCIFVAKYKGNFSWNRFHEKIFHTIFDLIIFFVPLPDPTINRFANVAALPNDVSLYRIQKLDLSNVKAADG